MTDVSIRGRATWLAHLFKATAYQYHRPFADRVRVLLPKDGIVIDVGAHSGQFAKLFARLVPAGRVLAFEPGPYALSILRIATRRFANIDIFEYGLSDEERTETLLMPMKSNGASRFGLSHIGGKPQAGDLAQEIRVRRLDDFASEAGLSRLDFIKIDIEGWEPNFLRGAAKTIEAFRPSILIEVNEKALVRAGFQPKDIFEALKPFDYSIFRTSEKNDYRMIPVTGFAGVADYLFVPAEKAFAINI